ncbi:hypothetical protein V6N13_116304 [Hibiscus sabdariffa]|uniref:Uncharacterized protein n=1 Tax=Hibiscus sabdariffa TaxID=183260 RepID=A0ABR2BZ75_9ROSI
MIKSLNLNFCSVHVYSPTAKYQYGDWLRAPVKKRQEATVQTKGRILFHEDGGSSTSHSEYTSLGNNVPCTKQSIPIATTPTQPPASMNAIHVLVGPVLPSCSPLEAAALAATSPVLVADSVDDVEDGFVRDEPAAAVDLVSGDVLAVDPMGTVHVSEPSFLGDERDVLVTHSSHLEIASVKAASNFETIDEWFAEDEETNIPVVVAPPLQVLAKRSSGGADSSKTKRARSSTPTSKDVRLIKAGMSSSKNSMAVVDRQPRRGK